MAEVERKLQDALRLDPRLARAHLLLCEIHLAHYFVGFDPSAARLRAAEQSLAAAEALGAEATELMRMRGFFLYWGRRDNAAAARAFEHAVRAMPNSVDAIYNLALVHRRSGRWPRAVAAFARAQELDPRNPRIARENAYTLAMIRDYAAAVKVFRLQQVFSPHDPALHALRLVMQFCLDGDLAGAAALASPRNCCSKRACASSPRILHGARWRSAPAVSCAPRPPSSTLAPLCP